VRVSIAIVSALLCVASPVFAQSEGRINVGGSVTFNHTPDDGIASTTTFGPLVRLTPRKGWRPTLGLNWFRANLDNPAGGSGDFARLRVRPLMLGVSYTTGAGSMLYSFSVVAGPSFNKAEFWRSYAATASESIGTKNSFAVRPGVGLNWTVAPRVGITGFAGYLIDRPDVVYHNRLGQEIRDQWKADAIVVSIGAVYSVF
jgi:hypothetical protein